MVARFVAFVLELDMPKSSHNDGTHWGYASFIKVASNHGVLLLGV